MENSREGTILISVKTLLNIIRKCKKIFISIFIALFILILLFTFFLVREYRVTSEINVSEPFLYYNDILYEYFPDDAINLWMEPEENFDYARISRLLIFKREIMSLPFLKEVSKQLDFKYDEYDLRKTIDITIDEYRKVLTLNIYAKNSKDAFLICNGIVEGYKNFKMTDFDKSYNSLLSKLDLKTNELNKELKTLDIEAQGSFLSPSTENKINNLFYTYNSLMISKENLVENKNYYVDKVNIIKEPEQLDKNDWSVCISNVSVSLIISFVSALILTFIINYLIMKKRV
jgi:capsular polysaccharide biosynthesis protein